MIGLKPKLEKGVQLLCLDEKWIPFEEAGGKLGIIQHRMFATAAKDKSGHNKGAYICGNVVEGTGIEGTATSPAMPPGFDGQNVSAPTFNIPQAGSGSARSPDDVLAAAAKPAAAAVGKPATRTCVIRGRSPRTTPNRLGSARAE